MSKLYHSNKINSLNVEIISIHVPRTAGTAFKGVIRQVYSSEEIFFDYPHKGRIRNRMLTKQKPEVKII
ncbi:MAG: hypothetical protein O4861_01735, partial [Trichodesmium sp. St16_bin4-tuft]|nr:hypothetical protein [Trichodesmium sp. St16_bin4-tuft]